MPNWNVYKVFANGKRAKSPYTTFEAEESQHFFENILPTLGPKLKKSKWMVLDTAAPQERPEGGTMSADDILAKKRNQHLSKMRLTNSLACYQRSLIPERRLSRGSTRLASSTQDWRSNQSC
jgi:hypothetical protein